ncbi:elongation factor G [Longispora albida]|uniref:elongation factor G n=1 Tax=Longispora albida TaxID=203523 RepID=UPI0004755C31|nr:TetM/TetW/TetO/TetS family tetracycline resistance ribosomal protection protein [Longispora albida]
MNSLNLGILAHVDAGKTSLTERLLHAAGVIGEVGSVDDGSTQTDSLALERQRGITIKSAVVSFALGGTTVNLIDTPGHPDFIAEVERVLGVLDGAVLVVSAVEGVQPQTRILMRALRRLAIPTLVFVNKADRRGADPDRVLREISTKLGVPAAPMTTVDAPGTPGAQISAILPGGPLTEVLAEQDDEILSWYLEGEAAPRQRLLAALREQTAKGLVCPVYTGSAITGAGVDLLTSAIRDLLPPAAGEADGPVSGTVFKVDRGAAGERLAYVRMFGGTLRTRDRLPQGRVTGIDLFSEGKAARATAVRAGQIAIVRGLAGIRIGDTIGEVPARGAARQFAAPSLETVIEPGYPGARGAMLAALAQLAEQDPLINLRQDDERQEVHVSLYGEVQKEVIEATLASEYGVPVTFRESTTVCVERVAGTGEDFEIIAKGDNPFLATVGLRVEPGPEGSGVTYRLGVELGSMPMAFMTAVESTVRETLGQGLHGWQVIDCVVTLTHSGYFARQSHSHGTFDASMSSTAGDFRNLTPLVLMDALRRAGTRVHEPIHEFWLEIPGESLKPVLQVLARLRGTPRVCEPRGTGYLLEGEIPAARVHELQQQLPTLTSGEGVLDSVFSHYQPLQGEQWTRPRTDHNPLNRKEYLRALRQGA